MIFCVGPAPHSGHELRTYFFNDNRYQNDRFFDLDRSTTPAVGPETCTILSKAFAF